MEERHEGGVEAGLRCAGLLLDMDEMVRWPMARGAHITNFLLK